MISAGCEVSGKVENSILFRNVVIEEGAKVKNCILMQHTTIKSGAVLENVVMDKYCTVGKDVKLCGTKDNPIVVGKNIDL